MRTEREHLFRRSRPTMGQLWFHLHLCCITSASQLLCHWKQDTTFSKNRYFQIQFTTIDLFQSPILRCFYKAALELSFNGALCCDVSAKPGDGSCLYPGKTSVVRDLKFWLLTSCTSSSVRFDLVTFSGVKRGFAIPISSQFEHSITFYHPCRASHWAQWGKDTVGRDRNSTTITHTLSTKIP